MSENVRASTEQCEEEVPFGTQEPGRFAADVEYRGRAGAHDYLVRVRHRLLDTTFTVRIDGIEHDPKAEQDAQKRAEAGTDPADGLRFRVGERFTGADCTVLRKGEDGEHAEAEVISVRTAGLGGAGEADVRHGLERTVLAPADGSPSAVRDAKRTEHPTRYALLAALGRSARFLLPLLGIGALFSGWLDPLKEWVAARVRPAVEAVVRMTEPVREWIDALLRPIRDFLGALLEPVRDVLAAVLRPVRDLLRWFFGLFPELPFHVPEWVADLVVPLLVVAVAFVGTFTSLRRRREKLEQARARTAGGGAAEGGGAADADRAAALRRLHSALEQLREARGGREAAKGAGEPAARSEEKFNAAELSGGPGAP